MSPNLCVGNIRMVYQHYCASNAGLFDMIDSTPHHTNHNRNKHNTSPTQRG